ncbi:MAG TPA: PEP-CTERM sorting domain-containing protein [Roseiarcus sp.]
MSTNIRLSAMGPPATCQGVVCPTAYGAVTVIGNTDSSLTYTITLTPGVSFLGAGDVFYFDLTTNGGGTFNFTDVSPGYSAPLLGSYSPGADFPGTYNYAVSCPTSLCLGPLTFMAFGASPTDQFVIGSPLGGGPFAGAVVPFVANLSVVPGTTGLCPAGGDVCTGLVAAPEPSTWGMMLLGFAGLGFVGYRRARSPRKALAAP